MAYIVHIVSAFLRYKEKASVNSCFAKLFLVPLCSYITPLIFCIGWEEMTYIVWIAEWFFGSCLVWKFNYISFIIGWLENTGVFQFPSNKHGVKWDFCKDWSRFLMLVSVIGLEDQCDCTNEFYADESPLGLSVTDNWCILFLSGMKPKASFKGGWNNVSFSCYDRNAKYSVIFFYWSSVLGDSFLVGVIT